MKKLKIFLYGALALITAPIWALILVDGRLRYSGMLGYVESRVFHIV